MTLHFPSPQDSDEVTSVEEDLDSVTANVEYVQQNILELQNELIAVEDARVGVSNVLGRRGVMGGRGVDEG